MLVLMLVSSRPTPVVAQCGPVTFYNVPEDIYIPCGSSLPAWPSVSASDGCGSLTVIRSQHKAGTQCGTIFYERRWEAMRGSVLLATAVQHIRFLDNTPPVLIVPNDTTIYCGNPVPPPTYISYDACSWNKVHFEEKRTDHNPCEYTLVRTWTAKDGCYNAVQKQQTIKVVDKHAPVITIVNPALKGIKLGEEIAVESCESPQALASDVKVTDCCSKITIEAYDRILVLGKCDQFGYYRKWRCGYIATDGAGNRSEFYFFMVQYDYEDPVLHNVPDDVTLACEDTIPPLDYSLVTAEDNCTRRTKPEVSEEYFYDPADSSNQAVRRTWYFEDDCGNSVEATRWIYTCNFDTAVLNPDTTGMEPDSMTTDTSMAGAIAQSVGGPPDDLVKAGAFVTSLEVFPNPARSVVTLRFEVPERADLKIQLVDKLGRILQQQSSSYNQGQYTFRMDLDRYPVGLYSVRMISEKGIEYAQIVKTE